MSWSHEKTEMKTTARLIFYAGVLITLDCRQIASAVAEREGNWKAKGIKEQVSPPRSNSPLLTLPSFSSFSLSGLNFPYLQAFSSPNRISSAERVRATKTEYVEVTRRQTVHPICYTAYETKAPCLPYAQSDFQEDDYDVDPETIHQVYDSFNLKEVKNVIQSTPTIQETTAKLPDWPIKEESGNETIRTARYLELKLRREGAVETSTKIEGSEFFPTFRRVPSQNPAIEYHTKTVLITKLEKYTDRRATATLLAVNCLPVDRSIPMCQNYPSPIKEMNRRSDELVDFQASSNHSPILTNSENFKSEIPMIKSEPTRNRNKTVDISLSESLEMNSEETLLGKD